MSIKINPSAIKDESIVSRHLGDISEKLSPYRTSANQDLIDITKIELSTNISCNGHVLTLQQWIDKLSDFVMWPHNVGDIAYWDGSKIGFVSYTAWTNSLGTAIGVCFIPTSHASVWGDGKARFLAVTGVDSAGTATSSEQTMPWDSQNRDAGLTKYTTVPTWDNTIGGSVGSSDYGYISSDNFSEDYGVQNSIDTATFYQTWGDEIYIPSPYTADGSFYEDYRRTISGNNVLSDFNGKTNTSAIVTALGTDGGQAAKACSLYSTSGTSTGDWYLPSAGELAYIMPRFNVIQSALTACNGVLLDGNYYYWSSSEYDTGYAYRVGTYIGRVYSYYKDGYRYVRPVVSLS